MQPFDPLFDPDGFAEAMRARCVQDAWVGYVSRYPWSHIGVLTPRYEVSVDRLLRECAVFSRRLERIAQGPVPWFAAAEGITDGRPHIHALIGGTAQLALRQVYRCWTLGHSHIRIYRGSARSIGYALKRLGEGPDAAEHSAFKLPREFRRL
jgi:hypothetical protein